MTVRIAVLMIVGCTLLTAAIGESVGSAFGTLAPGYYQSMFLVGREPGFNPVAIGSGQGLAQGTAGGAPVGRAVLGLLCWRDVQLRPAAGLTARADGSRSESRRTARRVLLAARLVLTLGLWLFFGLVLGLLRGERSAYRRRFLEDRESIAPVLAGHQAFAGVELGEYSAVGVYLMGEVPTVEDLARLRSGIVRAVGERRAWQATRGVSVRP